MRDALQLLTKAETIIDAVGDAEQDCLDNCPENLQGSERYERMESAVDQLNDALESLDEAKEHIQSAIT